MEGWRGKRRRGGTEGGRKGGRGSSTCRSTCICTKYIYRVRILYVLSEKSTFA